jgi:Domain of unknown function (DUF5916)/Carbohydrate family 9 binding domain-like
MLIRAAAFSLASLMLTTPAALAGLRSGAATPVIDAAHAQKLPGPGQGVTLTDEGWQTLVAVDAFTQREPNEGVAPSQRTEFRVAYDSTTLYVRVKAFDEEPNKIVTYLTRRDDNSPGDWLRVFVDSFHDRRTAYEFAVNPSGVKQDRYWFNDTDRDDSWDAVWNVHVSRDLDGWQAEFQIPFSQLRFTPGPTTTFGFAVVREIGRLKETSTWPLLPRAATGYVSSFGDLDGLSISSAPKRLELLPYIVSDLARQPTDGNPLVKASAPEAALGLDLKYALTSGLTFTGTVNPDFGQVEADPAVVNLSAFETFFNERRPFFVEGSGNFNFNFDDGNLFYTRRIGRSPQGAGDLPSGDTVFVDSPPQTTILGAGKVTGRVGKFSIGVLHAVTREEHADVINGAAPYQQPVEPLTNYSVGRARREFANQSSLGFIVTATQRRLTEDLRFLPSSAVTGGADFDWRFKSRYALAGYWVASDVRGDATAIDRIQQNSHHYFQRPGATSFQLDPAATSLAGSSAKISINKIGGERTRFSSNLSFKSPGFDISDLGFFRRADEKNMNNWFQIRSEKPSRWFRARYLNFNQYAHWNYDGDFLGGGGNVNGQATFTNNWSAGGGYNFNKTYFDDRLSRGGPGGLVEDYNGVWFFVNSDDRHAVSFNYNGTFFVDGHGSFVREYVPAVTVRPVPALSVVAGMRIANSVADAQWVNNVTDTKPHYVFGRLGQTTVSFTGRVSYTMRPTLSLQLYAEPFVSAGDYSSFKELVDGRNPVYSARYSPFAYPDNPDFNYRSFRTTNVLRWEYRPGSTLFVVWQQAREGSVDDGSFQFRRDFHDTFNTPGKNVFLVKLAYWLNY